MTEQEQARFDGRTGWSAALHTPLRAFVHAETRGSAVLLLATIAALVWVNIDHSSYESVWTTTLSIRLDTHSVSLSLREWINSGLMALFFLVVGLEARREADIGELRQLRHVTLPLLAGLGGMAVAAATYLVFTAGTSATHGWGVAISTDTAFALGVLAVVAPRPADRLRAFMLTVVVVDDIAALLVIAFAYSGDVEPHPLILAAVLFAALLVVRAARVRRGLVYAVIGLAMWLAVLESGVDPLVVGLVIGLLAYAYPAPRADLERATQEFRLFREQPTPEFARRARQSLESAMSPNDRLTLLWHPWTSYLVVPLFAFANVGVPLTPSSLHDAFTSAVTLGIVVGYVVGKPLGIIATSYLVTRLTHGRLHPPLGWGAAFGAGSAAGVGFTVSLLIATLAFGPEQLQDVKIGVIAAALASALLAWLVFRIIDGLPGPVRARALFGSSSTMIDLAEDVDSERDHVRGPIDAPVTLVEYGDLECSYCGQAEPAVRELLRNFADLRYAWRHLPLDDVHPQARLAAEATEAAAAQGRFWELHDLLLERQDALQLPDLVGYARQLGLDVDTFKDDLIQRRYAPRVARDVDSADLSGVSGTPTFFVNGRRHHGAFDLATLTAAVRAAGERATIAP